MMTCLDGILWMDGFNLTILYNWFITSVVLQYANWLKKCNRKGNLFSNVILLWSVFVLLPNETHGCHWSFVAAHCRIKSSKPN